MNSANGESIRDLQNELVYHPTVYPIDEKRPLKLDAERKSTNMSKLQHYVFTLLLLCLFAVGMVGATLNRTPLQGAAQPLSPEQRRFQELLDTVDASALHEVLLENLKDKYQHGVFQEAKTAVEAIHQTNAEVAESLIELAKRQATGAGNTTVVTTTATTTTDTVVTSTDSVTSTPSTSVPTTPPSSQTTTAPPTTQQSTSPPASPPSSTLPPSTTSSDSTSSTSTTPSSSSSSPSTSGSTSSTQTSKGSSPTNSSSSPSRSSFSTVPSSQSSNTVIASTSQTSQSESSTKTSSSSLETTVFASTMPNGAVTTFTSVTVVPAGQADQTTGGSAPAKTSNGSASLQTGASTKLEVGVCALLSFVGLVVVAEL